MLSHNVSRITAAMSIVLLAITLGSGCDAFSPSRISWICSRQSGVLQFQPFPNHSHKRPLHELCATNGDKSTSNSSETADIERLVSNEMGLEIIRGTGLENSDELPNETWEDLEDGAPSKWMILKDVSLLSTFLFYFFHSFVSKSSFHLLYIYLRNIEWNCSTFDFISNGRRRLFMCCLFIFEIILDDDLWDSFFAGLDNAFSIQTVFILY